MPTGYGPVAPGTVAHYGVSETARSLSESKGPSIFGFAALMRGERLRVNASACSVQTKGSMLYRQCRTR
ncbi:hypothetical protein ARMSODRAFT_967670 [Armillaria solidipes]|uniref:Uncharacterized protein n=1 Tax=Armillaria solidipes TaxID=1076256 RepID=A0A2H3AP18_9AGAR|nr:hypothetical protein ARMSODRAFT_967670 [Armillaria solidipes]